MGFFEDVRGAEELLNSLSKSETRPSLKRAYSEQANSTDVHIDRIRAMLLAESPQPPEE